MPRADNLKHNFLLGELSPSAKGQLRSDQYQSATDLLKNYHVHPSGGIFRRPGTRYVADGLVPTVGTDASSLLVPFVVSEDTAYILEFGHEGLSDKMNVYKDHALVASIAGGPGLNAQKMKFVQIGNVMIFTSVIDGFPGTLTRTSDTVWTFGTLEVFNGVQMNGPYLPVTTADDGSASNVQMINSAITTSTTITASLPFFNTGMAGRLLRIRDLAGDWTFVKLGTYSSSTIFTSCTILGPDFSAAGANEVWQMGLLGGGNLSNIQAFSAIGFYQDRLVLGGYDLEPARVDLSRTGVYNDFSESEADSSLGTVDDNAFKLPLNDKRVNKVAWVKGTDAGLLAGTLGSEWVINGADNDTALTANNKSARPFSDFGSTPNRDAFSAGRNLITLSNAQRVVRDVSFQLQRGGNNVREISTLSEHLMQPKIAQVAYQAEPHTRLWLTLLRDGISSFKAQAISVLYQPNAEGFIFGPSRIELGGSGNASSESPFIESMASIPSPDGSREEIWASVVRYINGAVIRHIEYFAPEFEEDNLVAEAPFLDDASFSEFKGSITDISQSNPAVVTIPGSLAFTTGTPVTFENISGMTELNGNSYTITKLTPITFEIDGVDSTSFNAFQAGTQAKMLELFSTITTLTHLLNETVDVVADGLYLGTKVVSNSGEITLTTPASRVHIGYKYNSDLRLLRPEAGSATGTALGKSQRTHRVSLLLNRTVNIKVGKDFTDLHEVRVGATDLFTGVKSVNTDVDYELGNRVCIRQDTPLPGAILALTQHLATQDR